MAKLSINSIKPEICNYYAIWGFLVIFSNFISIYMHKSFNPKTLLFAGRLFERFWKKHAVLGCARSSSLAARIIWRSGGQDMSYRRFRSDGGTHRVHFEQKTSGEDLDHTIAFRRPKSAKFHI